MSTDNYRKHTSDNPLQKYFIERFYDVLTREAARLGPESVLDAGCGEGFTLAKLSRIDTVKNFCGIDFLDRAIELGRKAHPDFDLRVGSIYKLPFKDKSFDMVICTEVLEHLEKPEDALSELARVCKKNVLISVPHEPFFMLANFLRGKNWSRWGNDIEHIQHWSRSGIGKMVGKYFDVVEVLNPFPWTLVVGKK